uniref:Uncharacterized protein n=1 Tax=Vespula pensylvanica TaxID=30213 RepID=A0A834UHT1_VESPE|nr:hypothetical protein H0235_001683 [Vespula pensylvanica]
MEKLNECSHGQLLLEGGEAGTTTSEGLANLCKVLSSRAAGSRRGSRRMYFVPDENMCTYIHLKTLIKLYLELPITEVLEIKLTTREERPSQYCPLAL